MVNGTLIWYSYICEREVWFIGHWIEPPQDHPLIEKYTSLEQRYITRDKRSGYQNHPTKILSFRATRITNI
ncbi:MAG: Dna2/Cas4 domain-containing protein [Candidatus Caldipriscus sp.]